MGGCQNYSPPFEDPKKDPNIHNHPYKVHLVLCGSTLNPKPLNPKPLNPEPLNPEPLNPEPLHPKLYSRIYSEPQKVGTSIQDDSCWDSLYFALRA